MRFSVRTRLFDLGAFSLPGDWQGLRRMAANQALPAEQQENMAKIDKGMTAFAKVGEELAATAEEMSAQAEQLQELMGFFKLEGTTHAATEATARARKRSYSELKKLAGAPAAVPNEGEFRRF